MPLSKLLLTLPMSSQSAYLQRAYFYTELVSNCARARQRPSSAKELYIRAKAADICHDAIYFNAMISALGVLHSPCVPLDFL